MGIQQVNRLLKIANNNDLPELENRYQELKKEVAILEFQKHNSVIILQELSNQITHLRNTSESYRSSCKELGLELSKLQIQKLKLDGLIEKTQNNDKDFLRIKHIAHLGVERILTDNRVLLKLALVSITESIRNNPGKFGFLFDSVSSMTPPIDYGLYSYKQYPSQDYYANVYTDMLLDEDEKFCNKLVKDFTNKTIIDAAAIESETSSLSLLPQSDDEEENQQNSINS